MGSVLWGGVLYMYNGHRRISDQGSTSLGAHGMDCRVDDINPASPKTY